MKDGIDIEGVAQGCALAFLVAALALFAASLVRGAWILGGFP